MGQSTASWKLFLERTPCDRVNNFAGLIDHLGTMTATPSALALAGEHPFTLVSQPTPLQEAAFKLLGVDPKRVPVAGNGRPQKLRVGPIPCAVHK